MFVYNPEEELDTFNMIGIEYSKDVYMVAFVFFLFLISVKKNNWLILIM